MQPQMNTSSAVPITSTAGRKPKNCTCAKRDSLSIALFIVDLQCPFIKNLCCQYNKHWT